MNPKLNQPLIALSRIEDIVQIEPALVMLGLGLIAWIIYKMLLRDASPERHKNLRRQFLNLFAHSSVFTTLFIVYAVAQRSVELGDSQNRVAAYLGLATLIAGAIVFVKVCRILMSLYLFIGHMREGVPLLIVNLFTLLLSIGIAGWFATELFGVKLGPLLATSAVFSLVLGLALQDTLGNLFAGVALQFDKPYEIGDWIEVNLNNTGAPWVGQVEEVTWRATTLIGLFDEMLIIPNRIMAQAQVANFSSRNLPIWRGQTFKIPYTADVSGVTSALKAAIARIDGVRKSPEPWVWVRESTESGLIVRCSYTIDDYGSQWKVGSLVITAVMDALKKAGTGIAAQRIEILRDVGSGSHHPTA